MLRSINKCKFQQPKHFRAHTSNKLNLLVKQRNLAFLPTQQLPGDSVIIQLMTSYYFVQFVSKPIKNTFCNLSWITNISLSLTLLIVFVNNSITKIANGYMPDGDKSIIALLDTPQCSLLLHIKVYSYFIVLTFLSSNSIVFI